MTPTQIAAAHALLEMRGDWRRARDALGSSQLWKVELVTTTSRPSGQVWTGADGKPVGPLCAALALDVSEARSLVEARLAALERHLKDMGVET